MTCYSPLAGYRSRFVNASGKRSVVFSPVDGYTDLPVVVPCGQCVGCRLERSRQWAMRCVHEAQLHEDNCFLTLTYDDEFLPPGGTLVKKHFQDFMKRLRKSAGRRISFFHCGEYGERLLRAHYHAIIFGYDFADKRFHKRTQRGDYLYTSALLSRLWPFGHCLVGAVTFESAAYVARYCVAKKYGDDAAAFYRRIDVRTGEICDVLPEYVTMSLRPAIGRGWYDKFSREVLQSDSVVMRGREMAPPKYYDKLHEALDKVAHGRVVRERKREMLKFADNNTPERLAVRRECKVAAISQLKRVVE